MKYEALAAVMDERVLRLWGKPSAKSVQSEDCRPKSRVLAARLQRRRVRGDVCVK